MKFAIFATVAVLLLISQQSRAADTDKIINGVGQVPPFNGLWYLCSEEKTKNLSYALRVFKNTTKVEPDSNFGETFEGDEATAPDADQIEPSVIMLLLTDKDLDLVLAGSAEYEYVPSLSCYPDFVRKCDHDTGKEPLPFDKYCLAMLNPSNQPANFNLTVSWSISIFHGKNDNNKLGSNETDNNESGSAESTSAGSPILLTAFTLGLVAFTFIGM